MWSRCDAPLHTFTSDGGDKLKRSVAPPCAPLLTSCLIKLFVVARGRGGLSLTWGFGLRHGAAGGWMGVDVWEYVD